MIARPRVLLHVIVWLGFLAASAQTQKQPSQHAVPDKTKTSRAAELPPTVDPKEIVRRSIEIDHHNWDLAQNYTCQQREVQKQKDGHGEIKSTEIKTFEVNFYYGDEYSRLVAKNDKPLSADDKKKEDEKLEKFLTRRRDRSEEEQQKAWAKRKKQREEGRAFLRDVVNAYDFKLIGEEKVDGEDAWVIEATPRKDFHPTQPHGEILSKIKAKVWIEKKDYNWVKVEAENFDTISFGLILARVHPGSHFSLEQTHLNDEVWLPRRFRVNGGIRIALLKNLNGEQEDTFTNYRKFSTTTRILPGFQELPDQTPPK